LVLCCKIKKEPRRTCLGEILKLRNFDGESCPSMPLFWMELPLTLW
jgi:hypothetical protein